MPIQRRSSGRFATSAEPAQRAPASGSGLEGPQQPKSRSMRGAELMGSRCHTTANGHSVSIVIRDGKFIARGRYEGHQFGTTLGNDAESATQQLRRLLVNLEDGTFVPGREAHRHLLPRGQVPNCDLRSLVNCYLADVRQLRGAKTTRDYQNRLLPILDFAESPDACRRWPKAKNIDRKFALGARIFLQNRDVRRNGKPGGPVKKMSQSQVRNCLETLNLALTWAGRADVRQLPPDFPNPMNREIIGPKPSKDPLRNIAVPMESRIRLVSRMDRWQLPHLSAVLVLPIRPETVAGALIDDLEDNGATLWTGTRLGGSDYNKGHVSVLIPVPEILQSLFQICVGGRIEQPLFRSRAEFQSGERQKRRATAPQTIEARFGKILANAKNGEIQTEQDRKQAFRHMLRDMGGISENEINKNFKPLFREIGLPSRIRPYEIRHSVTTDMHRAGVPILEQRYLTLHGTADILNDYTSLDPKREMEKYFQSIKPLLDAIQHRAEELGLFPVDFTTRPRQIAG